MKLSIIIPVYNERQTIQEIHRAVSEVDLEKEIILVDDFSSDGTRDIVKGLAGAGTQVYFHDRNLGKGAALRTGFGRASGDIVIVQDADLEYDPKQYGKLIAPILAGQADVVYGSRFSDRGRRSFSWHVVGNRALTLFSNLLSDLNLTDMETCYKAFRREILQGITIEENRFGFEPEFTAKIARLRLRVHETDISYTERNYRQGKKIGWKDGISALRCIVKYNLLR